MQAWLSIRAKATEKSNREKYPDVKAPKLPDDCEHLYSFLTHLGVAFVERNGLDGKERLVPLTFTEIHAWNELTQMELSPFEANALHKMSLSYCYIANNVDSACPVDIPDNKRSIDQARVAALSGIAVER